jgi:hypothetical protein
MGEIVHDINANHQDALSLVVDVGAPPQRFVKTRVILRTGLEAEPELEIPVTAFVSARLSNGNDSGLSANEPVR